MVNGDEARYERLLADKAGQVGGRPPRQQNILFRPVSQLPPIRPLVNLHRNTVRQVSNLNQGGLIWVFLIFLILVHVYDGYFYDFTRGDMGHVTRMIIIYFLIALLGSLFSRGGIRENGARYFLYSALAFGLPYILTLPFLRDNDYLVFALGVSPIWFLFAALSQPEDSFLHTLATWWMSIVVIIFAIIIIAGTVFPSVLSVPGTAQVGKSVLTVVQDFNDAIFRIGDRLGDNCLFSRECITTKLNNTFNPYAMVYAGQVEQSKNEPLGVFITDLRPLSDSFYPGVDPVIFGRLEARTFVPGGVTITPSCLLDGPRSDVGTTPEPKGPIEVNYQLIRDITCAFDATSQNITPGTYYGVMGVSFPFETWSYITNTFVSRSVIESFYLQDKDIHRELDIDETTEAIFTNGPVSLGVSASKQPIDIDLDAQDSTKYIQQNFGFTLQNRWGQGGIKDVQEFVVIVPEPFVLENCLPAVKNPSIKKDPENRVTNYTFPMVGENPQQQYHTINCQLNLPSKAAAEEVLAFGEKTPVTFVVIARYLYELEQRTRLRIEQ